MSMVSFLSCECSDQGGASEGMRIPGASIVLPMASSGPEIILLATSYQGVGIGESGGSGIPARLFIGGADRSRPAGPRSSGRAGRDATLAFQTFWPQIRAGRLAVD